MREFNLSHAVSTFATFSGRLGSLWGLYIAGTFAAAGFGASQERFTTGTAVILTLAFFAFAGAHLRAIMAILNNLATIRAEVLGRLESAPEEADFPATIRAAMSMALTPRASLAVHLIIDSCVVAVVWARVYAWV
jgi:hypothetical protein